MTKNITYQCQKCGRTMEFPANKKIPPLECSKGGKSDWKEPSFFR